jgi:hypothetical protein
MQRLSQCQAFQRLVRSSHTLVNWTFDLLNRFSISLACLWKHWMLFASVRNINTTGQWKESLGQTSQSLCSSFSGRTNATSALSLRSRIITTSAVKGLSARTKKKSLGNREIKGKGFSVCGRVILTRNHRFYLYHCVVTLKKNSCKLMLWDLSCPPLALPWNLTLL